MNPSPSAFDYQTIALWLLGGFMTLLSFLGFNLWTDVKLIKEKWITREEFNDGLKNMTAVAERERDKKHVENTGNFRRLEEKIDRAEDCRNENAVALETRLGEILVKIAENQYPKRRDGGPERRRY